MPNDDPRQEVQPNKVEGSLSSPQVQPADERPSAQVTEERISEAKKLLALTRQMLKAEVSAQQLLEATVQQAKQTTIEKQLADTPVEKLAGKSGTKGIRWSAIKSGGFHTVADLQGVSAARLERLKGVGPSTSTAIVQLVSRHVAEITDSSMVRIDPEALSPSETKVLQAVADLDTIKQAVDPLREELIDTEATLAKLTPKAARTTSLWWRIFSLPSWREEYRNLLAQLIEFLDGTIQRGFLEDVEAAWAIVQSLPTMASTALERFRARPAEFMSLLASVDGHSVETAERGDLPTALSELIANNELDLSLLTDVTLRRYQAYGAKFALHQKKVLLGDEMGLGKTLEALACVSHLAANGARFFLVVCPTSVIVNWENEVRRFTSFEPIRLHGNHKFQAYNHWKEEGGIAITTYGTLTAFETWSSWSPSLLIVDEAHFVKNPQAKRSKAIRHITKKAKHVIYLTGTPLENRIEEFERLVDNLNEHTAASAAKAQTPTNFRRSVAPVYLRRTQQQVLKELPERIVIDDWLVPTPGDQVRYLNAVERGHVADMRRAAIVANKTSDSAKLRRLDEIVDEAIQNGAKIIVYSFFLDALASMARVLGDRAFAQIDGSVSPQQRQQIIDDFTSLQKPAALLAQIDAGGVGLNIQAASVVVIAEPQWKPSTEAQAIARSHRMGQLRSVVVHRLLTIGTFDRWVNYLVHAKRKLADDYVPSEAAKREPDALDPADLQVVKSASGQRNLEQAIVEVERRRLIGTDVATSTID